MTVYIIREGDTDRVKIGWSRDPEKRRRGFQTHHHAPLTIIRVIDGPRGTEMWMQRRFADRQINREWFLFCDEMLTVDPVVPKPKAEISGRDHLDWTKTDKICPFCGSIKQFPAKPLCTDCDVFYSMTERLPKQEQRQRLDEFFAAIRAAE